MQDYLNATPSSSVQNMRPPPDVPKKIEQKIASMPKNDDGDESCKSWAPSESSEKKGKGKKAESKDKKKQVKKSKKDKSDDDRLGWDRLGLGRLWLGLGLSLLCLGRSDLESGVEDDSEGWRGEG